MAKKDNSYDMDDSSSSKKSLVSGKVIGLIVAIVLLIGGFFFFQNSGKQTSTAMTEIQKETLKPSQETVMPQAATGQPVSASNQETKQTHGNAGMPVPEEQKDASKLIQTSAEQHAPSAQSANASKVESEKLTILFGFNKSDIDTSELSNMERFWSKIKTNKGSVTIAGYTDNIGSVSYNKVLSRKRAESISNKLREYGLDNGYKLAVAGFGEANPVADNGTSEGQAQNRRAEIVFSR